MNGLWFLALIFFILIFRERNEEPKIRMERDENGFYYPEGECHDTGAIHDYDRDMEGGMAAVYTWNQYEDWRE